MRALLLAALPAAVGAGNPFAGQKFYVNPANQAEYDSSIATASGTTLNNLKVMRETASAYWLDVKAKINGTDLRSLKGILADAASKSPPELSVFIVYDLPNRDCKAKASNGEICCTKGSNGLCDYNAGGDCAAGINEYKTEYINPIAQILGDHGTKSPVVLIIEPDSLPNLATNLGDPHCGNTATQAAYNVGIPYAINTLYAANPAVQMYMDGAHGGWLGWDDNLNAFVDLVNKMNVATKLRGFTTNVANYQPVGDKCPWEPSTPTRNDYCLPSKGNGGSGCCADPCNLESQWNQGNNEMNFAKALQNAMSLGISGFSPMMVIDTGRNGVTKTVRGDCANWCNPRNMGAGLLPTTATADSSLVDAYYWLKTPGESDGCTQTLPDGSSCPRYDSFCGSADSIGSQSGEPRSPEAGKWFDYQVKQLALNADFGSGPLPPPSPPGPPAPTPPAPTPPTPPSGDCPGGSLSSCMDLCPSSPAAAYKACVNNCVARCPSSVNK